LLVALALLLQDQRDGWPFSRHHAHSVSSLSSTEPTTHDPGSGGNRAAVALDAAEIDTLGVRVEPAKLEVVSVSTRHVATVTPDEGRLSHVHARVSGWVERLYVDTTGASVTAGQPLAAIFSQDLFASQTEYLVALQRSRELGGSAVLDAARTRLKLLGMTDAEIAAIEREGAARRLVTIVAPRSGVVLRRGVTVGTSIDASTELLTVADLTSVWVIAEVAEADAAGIAAGTEALLEFPGSGRAPFTAAVELVYPTLSERTRTVRTRLSVPNADGALRPGLYGTATFTQPARTALTVPRDAVVDTGESQHVFVHAPTGVLEPRPVRVGTRIGARVEIVEGIEVGEEVVSAGVFLIDSESRLRASGIGVGHVGHGNTAADEASAAPSTDAPHSDHAR
jgi:Cu(I)/Ag(I) efflux system membrane fusion protein